MHNSGNYSDRSHYTRLQNKIMMMSEAAMITTYGGKWVSQTEMLTLDANCSSF
ncbi:MAG TPA: hypothetical protein PKG75_02525 [Clostridiales bacterium]|nr:hypothetical protein [Clostridiales bacterium]